MTPKNKLISLVAPLQHLELQCRLDDSPSDMRLTLRSPREVTINLTISSLQAFTSMYFNLPYPTPAVPPSPPSPPNSPKFNASLETITLSTTQNQTFDPVTSLWTPVYTPVAPRLPTLPPHSPFSWFSINSLPTLSPYTYTTSHGVMKRSRTSNTMKAKVFVCHRTKEEKIKDMQMTRAQENVIDVLDGMR